MTATSITCLGAAFAYRSIPAIAAAISNSGAGHQHMHAHRATL
jgi:hypothetical protein